MGEGLLNAGVSSAVEKEEKMKSPCISLMVLAAAGLLIAGCSQAAPAPAPTAATAGPKAAEPTKAAAPAAPTSVPAVTQPTAAPAPTKKVDFPIAGKAISILIPASPGGDTDLGFRLLGAEMEKILGVPVQNVSKPGAGGQVGITELANSKPDGYTVGVTFIPTGMTMYLDPERKAVFNRKSFAPIGNHVVEPVMVGVRSDSRYKTMKDLIDAAKAKPDTITMGFTGILGQQHLALLELEKLTGAKFAVVPFDGAAPAQTALLGGHIEVHLNSAATFLSSYKNGDVRLLGIMDSQESPFIPGVKTLESQGFPVNMSTYRILSAPAGTPKEIVDVLAAAMKKATESADHQAKMKEVGLSLRYMDPVACETLWANMESEVQPLVEEYNKSAKK